MLSNQSRGQLDKNDRHDNAKMIGELLEPLSLQLPPTYVDVVSNATWLSTNFNGVDTACEAIQGETSSFCGCGKDGAVIAKCLKHCKQPRCITLIWGRRYLGK